jgi:hypothetical protein
MPELPLHCVTFVAFQALYDFDSLAVWTPTQIFGGHHVSCTPTYVAALECIVYVLHSLYSSAQLSELHCTVLYCAVLYTYLISPSSTPVQASDEISSLTVMTLKHKLRSCVSCYRTSLPELT